jgi:hypothetical protein
LYIVLITTLDEAKRYGKGGRRPRQNIYFGQGWEGRNGKYGILTDGKEGKEGKERKGKERKGKERKGKERDESVELCPVYIIAYWPFMPVHSRNQEEQLGWVAHGYVNEVLIPIHGFIFQQSR